MYINLLQTVLFCHFQQCVQMRVMAVYPAVGKKSEKMQGTAVLLCVFHRQDQLFIFKEVTVLNGLGDAGQILIDNPSGAHIHMADLRIPHLSLRQADCQTAGLSLHVRTLCFQLIHNRRIRLRDCVMLSLRVLSVSV